jgi:hypothetical protein
VRLERSALGRESDRDRSGFARGLEPQDLAREVEAQPQHPRCTTIWKRPQARDGNVPRWACRGSASEKRLDPLESLRARVAEETKREMELLRRDAAEAGKAGTQPRHDLPDTIPGPLVNLESHEGPHELTRHG